MGNKTKIDPAKYENRSFADEFSEAMENGTIIRAVPGKNIIDVAREQYLAKKKNEIVSVELPKPLLAIIKRQAKNISVPWTSYIRSVLEVGVNKDESNFKAKTILAE